MTVEINEQNEAHGHEHKDVSGGWLRPAVFGAMDGLVTNVSLIAGVGAGVSSSGGSPHLIVLTGLAGLAAGAFEDAGDALARTGHRTDACAAYASAYELFESAGAATDLARITHNGHRIAGLPAPRHRTRPTIGWASLTPSEITIARHVAAGLRNRDIAEQLVISRHTVESHLKHIFTKLDVQSRVGLALLARQHLKPT